MVLLSDGVNTAGSDQNTLQQAQHAADEGITIYTVGFGDADQALLNDVAEVTGGDSYYVDDADDLPEVFSRVANESAGQYTDDDEFPDALESGGVPVSLAVAPFLDDTVDTDGIPGPDAVQTDPEATDTDGDGLDDDEELGELRTTEQYIPPYDATIERYYYTVDADPTDPNSDDRGLTDSEEVQKGSNPRRYEVLDVGYATTLGRKDGTIATVQRLEQCCDAVTLGAEGESVLAVPASRDSGQTSITATFNVNLYAGANGQALEAMDDSEPVAFLQPSVSGIINNAIDDVTLTSGPDEIAVRPGQSVTYSYTVEIDASLGYSFSFRTLYDAIDFDFRVENLDETPFYREAEDGGDGTYRDETRYAVAGAPLLDATAELVDRTADIYQAGITIASAPTKGLLVVRTVKESLEFTMREVTDGQVSKQFPTTGGNPARSAAVSGVKIFDKVIVEREINDRELDYNVTTGGPSIIRQN
jgi:hypothetical protein